MVLLPSFLRRMCSTSSLEKILALVPSREKSMTATSTLQFLIWSGSIWLS